MSGDFATRFLNRKRKEQKGNAENGMNIIIIAPSPYERYGVNDGMGQMPLQSGEYTGNGPNGIPEPSMPTQRRMTPDGKPYVVDEAEVLVNDAGTVNDYGGPDQLDQFIQQNRPSGQQRQDQPVRMMYGGSPYRYQAGGMPSQQSQGRQPMFLERSGPGIPLPPPQPKPMPAPAGAPAQGGPGAAVPGAPRPIAGPQRPMPQQPAGPGAQARRPIAAQPGQFNRMNPMVMQNRQPVSPTVQPMQPQRIWRGGVPGMPMRYCVGGTPRRYFQGGIPSKPERMYPAGTIMPPRGTPQLAPTGRFEPPIDRQLNILREVRYGQIPRMDGGGAVEDGDYGGRDLGGDASGNAPKIVRYDSLGNPVYGRGPALPTGTAIGQANVGPANESITFDNIGPSMPDMTDYTPQSTTTIPEWQLMGYNSQEEYDAANSQPIIDTSAYYDMQIPTSAPEAKAEGVPMAVGAPKYNSIGEQVGVWTQEDIDANVNVPAEPKTTTGVAGPAAVSPAVVDQMMMDQYLTRLGRMSESERAAEAQRLLQQGYDPQQIQGMMATSDVSRRSAMGEATAQYATDAAARAESRATQQQAFEESKRRWNEQFGLDVANQMVKDAGTMTLQSWLQKYPNMTDADYTMAGRMSDVAWRAASAGVESQLSQNMITDASFMSEESWLAKYGSQGMTSKDYFTATTEVGDQTRMTAGYLSTAIMQKPDYDWRSDETAKAYLRRAWEEQGSPGSFEQWADTYVGGLKTSKATATVNAMKNEDWYVNAPSGVDENGNQVYESLYKTDDGKYTKQFYDDLLFPALSVQTTFPGLTWGLNENNNLILKDTTTGVDIDVSAGATAGGDEVATTPASVESVQAEFDKSYYGPDLNDEAFKAFYDSHDGQAPKDEDEWIQWSMYDRKWGTDDASVDNAIYIMEQQDEVDIGDITASGMRQWLDSHNGKLPTSESQWESWSRSGREYDSGKSEDRAAAAIHMADMGWDRADDDALVEKYLGTTGGYIKNKSNWDAFVAENPDVNEVINKLDATADVHQGFLTKKRDAKSGDLKLVLSDIEYRALLDSPQGQQYLLDPSEYSVDAFSPRSAETAFSKLSGRAFKINGQTYIGIGYGGNAGQDYKTFKVRNIDTGKETSITALYKYNKRDEVNWSGWYTTDTNKYVEGNPANYAGTIEGVLSQILK